MAELSPRHEESAGGSGKRETPVKMAEQPTVDPEKGTSAGTDKTRLVRQQASPPSYESLYGRVKSAKSESSGFVSFMKSAFLILVGTAGCTFLLAFFMAIPIAMIVIGAYYLHDCPAERYIPIYLVVGGCFAFLRMFISVGLRIRRACNPRESDEDREEIMNPLNSLLDCFQIAWQCWIYRTYGKFNGTDQTSENFCDPTLYYFAFWLTTSVYIFMALGFCCACCFGICAQIIM
ncbi:hypothetical protein C0Q70_05587 [Pomacea canaliculata]|uniref:Transmembrane protein n=1 Tax=Pomacea canaliculata TaxID=400727 RepID=A0A2T7PLL0_POMCA|nr:hypothetical protein C0Q70_05587 [Pomacea canaliculata]